MRRQSLLFWQAFPFLLASSLVVSSDSLWAQKSPPLKKIQVVDRAIQLGPIPEARFHLGPVPETLPEAPRSQTESHETLFRITYHHTLISTQAALNFQQSTTAELLGKAKYLTDSASSQWLTDYSKVHYPTIQPADHLQHYSHHIPWAGPSILLVSRHAKAHPHVTRVLELLLSPSSDRLK